MINKKERLKKAKQIYENYKDDFSLDEHGNCYLFHIIDEDFVMSELFKALTYIFEEK